MKQLTNNSADRIVERKLSDVFVLGASFLAADQVAKKLPPTATWALGWGAIATTGSYLLVRVFAPDRAAAAAFGVAGAYLHAYTHQTPFPHR